MTASENDKVAAATSTVMIDVPQELLVRYGKLAETTGRSREFLMNEALERSIDKLEYEFGLLKKVEDYRAGKLETYSLDEVREALGLD
ncbi:antitoxin [Collinsella tanakaei]|uniref:type II toxin-antitoxin system RelB family antitoxin n=1 Tax=Collinsella tanakaei TaxID=626935 RepID=UPI003AB8D69E